jgi:hypothetical protein
MSDESTALVPLQKREVEFYGDQVLAVLVEVNGQEQVYVPLRPIVEYLGLTWPSQTNRLRRDPVLADAVRNVFIMKTNSGPGNPNMLCLPLELLPGWLFGLTTSKVRPELKDKLDRYRRECFRVLWQAFQGDWSGESAGSGLAVLRDVARMGRAITALAEQQIAYQLQTSSRLDKAAAAFQSLDRRVTTVERQIAGGEVVTEAQASEIAARVKSLAEYLTSKDPTKNHYQGIFAELYRRFRVSSYHSIALADYAAVMEWLDDWARAAGAG